MGFFKPNLDRFDYVLRFFVPYENDYYADKISRLEDLLENYEDKNIYFEVVSLLMHPEKAKEYNVFSTPCLVRTKPEPSRNYVGVFHCEKALTHALDSLFEKEEAEKNS